MLQIGVIGKGEAKGELYKKAEEVGKEIAKSGSILVCGGLYGVMEACARGAKKMGGVTVGILPGFEKDEANDYIDIKIVTAMSHARNVIIARTADVLIAVDGGLGTLSEISLALKIGKPVIVLRGEGDIADIANKIRGVHLANTPKEAVKLAVKLGNI